MEGKVSLWTLESPMTTSRTGSLSASIATKDCRGTQSMKKWKVQEKSEIKKTKIKRRVLVIISSKHGTSDLPCKFSE